FNWIDITATGIKIPGLSDDSSVGPYPLGFKFPFYDLNTAHFYLCSNGFINFSSHFAENSHKPIPNTDLPYLIAPYWTDLVIDSTAAVYYLFDGEKCIIEWYQARQYGSHNRFTFEILLYPNGTIIFQYLTMRTPNTNASIGIQNGDGMAGLGIAFNTVYVHDQLAIRIANSLDWLKVGSPTRGVVLPDSFVTIPVQFFANQNPEKNHFAADIIINSSGYLTPRLVVPVEMTVRINARIAGRIFAATTPLAGVTVQAWKNYPAGLPIQTTVTNTHGNYAFLLPPELHQCDVRAFLKGYWPVVKSQVPVNQTAVHLNLTAIPPVAPTPEWVHFVSQHTRFWGEPVQPGDVITTADPDGILCGSFTVVTPGAYGILLAYADDATTPQIDEGAQPGDTLTFFINGIAATVSSPEAPIFTMPGDLHQVDLEVGKMAVQNIPLNAGWNLVSWHLDTPDDEGTHLFHQIFSNLIVVMGFDGVSQVFDPRHPQLSTLKYLDHRHGYWIKVTQACELPIWGQPLDVASVPIPCRRGYNLISYLPGAPDSLAHALASVNEHLVRVMGYENGGLVYDPAWPAFNSLHILQPNFGYWLWLAEKDSLWYPQTAAPLPDNLNQPDFITVSDFQKSKLTAVNATPEWIYVMAGGTQIYPELLPVGSHLQAIDPHGIICGDYAVTQPGQLGFMAIYRDDPRTDLDEGAEPGDLIHFSINEKSLPFTTTWTKFGDIIDLAPELTVVTQTDAMPTTYALLQNYPNPFNPTTIIKFQIPEASVVNLKILNLLGEEVRTLLAAPRPPGQYQIIWDGCDNQGNLLATGVYFYTLKTTHFQQTKKLVRIK
ncbi:T9SS type A sorting domain-containing protein, partial [candidate division KSB1 bacterium]|nr:T9SS type A sorting domain-containing protein [candidate division KSB1 bacterium]